MSPALSLSIKEARQLVLLSQFPAPSPSGTLAHLTQLGYVQIDSIAVIQRAHHHTLWNRSNAYEPTQLEQLVSEKKVFEYWSHAAAYLPMCDYRYSLPRKQALASGQQTHWCKRNPSLMRHVLDRIHAEGPLRARDFENAHPKTAEWQQKPAKQALESLFMQGDLMVPYRDNFQKVYDLTERVLPADINDCAPQPLEHACFLIKQFLQAQGLGQLNEFGYLLKGMRPELNKALKALLTRGEVLPMKVEGLEGDYYGLPQTEALLSASGTAVQHLPRILSPFDNLLIQRKRTQQLFNFVYHIECYRPPAKRQYGYFSLPLLWDNRLLARMDCKAERKMGLLHIYNLVLEPGVKNAGDFAEALCKALPDFLRFNGCIAYQLHTCSDPAIEQVLRQQS